MKLPWAEPHGRFTLLFERFAIEILLYTTIQAARKILGITWDEAWHIKTRAVERGIARKPELIIPVIGVDEKSAGKGQRNYILFISDLKKGTVEEVTIGRDHESLESYFRGLTEEHLSGVEAVSMDKSKSYISAVCNTFPDGKEKIVFDRFHIMQHVGTAVDEVRRQELQTLAQVSKA